LPVTEACANTHAAALGSWEHERLIVPVKPLEVETVTDVLPDIPGAETNTCPLPEGTEAENPGVIVKVWDCVVLLGLKLLSPP
jgi:hypothetical protein